MRFSQINNCPENATDNVECLTNLPQVAADGIAITTVLTIVFSAVSAIAVTVIVIQAIKFTLSQGDPDKAAGARKSIIYALIGLAISLSANVIVIFLLQDVLA